MDIKAKRRIFHALLANLGLLNSKSDILAGYGCASTLDMEVSDLDDAIFRIRQMAVAKNEAPPEMRRWRSYVLKVLTEMGVCNDNDWRRVNAYLMDKRISGKLLYEHSIDELKALHRKLKGIQAKQRKEDAMPGLLKINLN